MAELNLFRGINDSKANEHLRIARDAWYGNEFPDATCIGEVITQLGLIEYSEDEQQVIPRETERSEPAPVMQAAPKHTARKK